MEREREREKGGGREGGSFDLSYLFLSFFCHINSI
jgi:hypothetical protein